MNQNTYNRSTYLFADQSFWTGAASAFDLTGTMFNEGVNLSKSDEEADIRALTADWYAICDDLATAMNQVIHEHREPRTPSR